VLDVIRSAAAGQKVQARAKSPLCHRDHIRGASQSLRETSSPAAPFIGNFANRE